MSRLPGGQSAPPSNALIRSVEKVRAKRSFRNPDAKVSFTDLLEILRDGMKEFDDRLNEHTEAINTNDRVLTTEETTVPATSSELRGNMVFVPRSETSAADELWIYYKDAAGADQRLQIL